MDRNERRIIDELFTKLREAEAGSGPRDPEAERLIAQHVDEQPAAPYYMAQAIVVQQDALAAAQARIQELEGQAAERPAGGFLSGLFGGGQAATRPSAPPSVATGMQQSRGPWGQRGQGGFLAGAMQTAMGVAGGVLVANAIAGLLAPNEAAAAEPPPEDLAGDQDLPEAEPDVGGDFDFGGDSF